MQSVGTQRAHATSQLWPEVAKGGPVHAVHHHVLTESLRVVWSGTPRSSHQPCPVQILRQSQEKPRRKYSMATPCSGVAQRCIPCFGPNLPGSPWEEVRMSCGSTESISTSTRECRCRLAVSAWASSYSYLQSAPSQNAAGSHEHVLHASGNRVVCVRYIRAHSRSPWKRYAVLAVSLVDAGGVLIPTTWKQLYRMAISFGYIVLLPAG